MRCRCRCFFRVPSFGFLSPAFRTPRPSSIRPTISIFHTNESHQAKDTVYSYFSLTLNQNACCVGTLLLFVREGFYREARQAFLEVTGGVDGSAPLDDFLERLFPTDPADKHGRCA